MLTTTDRYLSAREWRTRKNSNSLRGGRVEFMEMEVQWRHPPGVGSTNNNNNSDNDNVMITIIIMIINYTNDRGFGFFRYMIPNPLPTEYSSLFECTPLAMTYAIRVKKYVLLLA